MLLGVVLVLAGLFVYLLYMPLQEEHGKLVQRVQDLESQLVRDRRIAADLPRFREEHERMQDQLKQALKQLPNDKEIPKLLTSIASTAKGNGLNVLYFKPGGESPRGFYAEVPVNLQLVGTYHQIARFFYEVGSLPRIVNLSNVSLGGAKNIGGNLALTVNCLATTFRFLEQEANKKKDK